LISWQGFDEEPEPQPFGDRFGPPRKYTAAGLLDPSQFPRIRPKCFGCSRPLSIPEIKRHILSCDQVSALDLARFQIAFAEFNANPMRAREIVKDFLDRLQIDRPFQSGDESL
jgi:hypothetical protein